MENILKMLILKKKNLSIGKNVNNFDETVNF